MNKSLIEIIKKVKEYIELNYSKLYISYKEDFVGYKFNSSDYYFIFFISLYNDEIMITYREDITKREVIRENIEKMSFEDLYLKISQIIEKTAIKLAIEINKNDESLKKEEKIVTYRKEKVELSRTWKNVDKESFSEEYTKNEYEQYYKFYTEIIDITYKILDRIKDERQVTIFIKKMGLENGNSMTLRALAKENDVSHERIRQILLKTGKRFKIYRNQYIKIFNLIEKEKYKINYIKYGLLENSNVSFFKFVLETIDEEFSEKIKDILRQIYLDYKEAYKENRKLEKIKKKEEKFLSLVNFTKRKVDYEMDFWFLTPERDVFEYETSGKIKLNKSKGIVEYESILEHDVLLMLDSFSFVKEIKTQAMKINVTYEYESHRYYPDIEVLTTDNHLIIIEVKPKYNMANSIVLDKYEALARYCKYHGYGYIMVDDRLNTPDTIALFPVDEEKEKCFIEYLKEKKSITYMELKKYIKEYDLSMDQVLKIVITHRDSINFTNSPFCIQYIEYEDYDEI